MSLRTQLRRRYSARGSPPDREGCPRSLLAGSGLDPAAVERGLWIVAIASFAADLALTVVGRAVGLVEVNPVARGVLQAHGALGLVGLKGLVLAFAAGLWVALPTRFAPVVPAGLALPTVPAVVYNAALVALVVL